MLRAGRCGMGECVTIVELLCSYVQYSTYKLSTHVCTLGVVILLT
jgi:hypothetical protein